MKKLGLLLALSITMLTACSQFKPTEPTETLMEVTIYPGGAMLQEDFENKTRQYTILMDGKFYNKKGKKYQMSEEDTKELIDCYNKLEDGNYTETESLICDGPSYEITISNNGDKFESGAVTQIDEVDKIVEIIDSYD